MSTKTHVRLSVIGATGSVGSSVLDICRRFKDRFIVASLAARSNARELLALCEEFGARTACLWSPTRDEGDMFRAHGIELLRGEQGLTDLASVSGVDQVVFASSGTDAIPALARALKDDLDVSLANKESIVAAGPWIMPLVKRPDQLRPIDSEHSAVWQCLRDEPKGHIKKILLTASGGPFREWSAERMSDARPSDALAHPVWRMGAKITIDSATLMNKGIECIEAMRLFGLAPSQVGALIHPTSIVHGLVEFIDSTMKMLASRPDMRMPSGAAISWPDRVPLSDAQDRAFDISLSDAGVLEFFEPDVDRFPCLAIALDAAEAGPAYPPIMIGADEAAVAAFLDGRIGFTDIPRVIQRSMDGWSGSSPRSIEDAVSLISDGARAASSVIEQM